MNAEALRKLKHELRTPINHILGYSDLLLESAEDSDESATADLARNIHASGQVLARLLEKNLLSITGEIDDGQMEILRESVRPVVKQILDTLASHTMLPGADLHQDDLGRIRRAGDQLLVLLNAEKISVSE
ncbi:MAG TPA: histidine kinase dimerization/phospho-acceptor domain-containing protein [Blattabacteriaceae bacterium]|jgi:K+-sensing histidine kinase KdpD|nr:histidine kinase dimerization/phospho-acceptor domain-containing protein [Blattabacteriaceae bacterium]